MIICALCIFGICAGWQTLVILSLLAHGAKWAVLVPAEKRPTILNKKHTDYPFWPLTEIPRSITAFISTDEPTQLLGNVPDGEHLDIPKRGWCLTFPLGIVWTYFHWHVRVPGSARFDYSDGYYNITATAKRRN